MTCSVNSIAIAPIDVVVIAIRATEIPSHGRSCLSDAARASAAPCLFRLKARWMTTAAVVRSDETMNHSSDAPLTLGSTAAASMQVGRTQAASAILMSVKAVEGFAQRVTASFRTRSQYVTATAAVLSNTNTTLTHTHHNRRQLLAHTSMATVLLRLREANERRAQCCRMMLRLHSGGAADVPREGQHCNATGRHGNMSGAHTGYDGDAPVLSDGGWRRAAGGRCERRCVRRPRAPPRAAPPHQ